MVVQDEYSIGLIFFRFYEVRFVVNLIKSIILGIYIKHPTITEKIAEKSTAPLDTSLAILASG